MSGSAVGSGQSAPYWGDTSNSVLSAQQGSLQGVPWLTNTASPQVTSAGTVPGNSPATTPWSNAVTNVLNQGQSSPQFQGKVGGSPSAPPSTSTGQQQTLTPSGGWTTGMAAIPQVDSMLGINSPLDIFNMPNGYWQNNTNGPSNVPAVTNPASPITGPTGNPIPTPSSITSAPQGSSQFSGKVGGSQ